MPSRWGAGRLGLSVLNPKGKTMKLQQVAVFVLMLVVAPREPM